MTVTLVQPYDPAWPLHFQQVKAFVQSGLVGVNHTIGHVGSTAIPGMTAKPIIDLDVVVSSGGFDKAKAGIEALGYIHQGDLGIPGRQAFDLANAEAKSRLPAHHLYVCEDGAYELRKHLAFRDFLRQRPEWRERLSQLKRELCTRHNNDRQAYINGKAAMVEEITKLAMAKDKVLSEEYVEKTAMSYTVASVIGLVGAFVLGSVYRVKGTDAAASMGIVIFALSVIFFLRRQALLENAAIYRAVTNADRESTDQPR